MGEIKVKYSSVNEYKNKIEKATNGITYTAQRGFLYQNSFSSFRCSSNVLNKYIATDARLKTLVNDYKKLSSQAASAILKVASDFEKTDKNISV